MGRILGTNSPTMKPAGVGTSRKQGTAVGSGSKPGTSKVAIKTSAPDNPRTLGRSTPSALK
jgi:hypothetical protein